MKRRVFLTLATGDRVFTPVLTMSRKVNSHLGAIETGDADYIVAMFFGANSLERFKLSSHRAQGYVQPEVENEGPKPVEIFGAEEDPPAGCDELFEVAANGLIYKVNGDLREEFLL